MTLIWLIGGFYFPIGAFRFPVGRFDLNIQTKCNLRAKEQDAKRKVKASKGKTLLDALGILLHL